MSSVPTVRTIAVLGAGIMGRGIAYVSALGGYSTVLYDTSGEALDRAVNEIWATLEKGVLIGKVESDAAAQANRRIQSTRSLQEAVTNADLVIEAVPEDIDIKLELFAALDKHAKPDAFLASNTSSLSITEMAAATERPARVVGM